MEVCEFPKENRRYVYDNVVNAGLKISNLFLIHRGWVDFLWVRNKDRDRRVEGRRNAGYEIPKIGEIYERASRAVINNEIGSGVELPPSKEDW